MPAANPWKKSKDEQGAVAGNDSPEPAAAAAAAPGGPGRLRSSRGKKGEEPPPPPKPASPAPDSADESTDEHNPGRIKNLAGFFATQTDDKPVVRKKRLEVGVDDSPDTIIRENEPIQRIEGVIRADDPGEWQKPIELEKGWAKNMASLFLNKQQEGSESSKKPFVMDLDTNETTILESEPVVLEGVVRNVDKTKDVISKRGRIKNIAGRFASQTATGDDDDEAPTEYKTDQPEVEKGKAKSMADRFKSQTQDGGARGNGPNGAAKPLWQVEFEQAKEYGVFENEPEVRSDVVHADDDQPDVISVQHTRNLRAMWTQFEKEEMAKDGVSSGGQKRADLVVRKKKEPSPEPEPEPPPPPPPVEEPAPKSKFGAKFGKSTSGIVGVAFGGKGAGAGPAGQKGAAGQAAVAAPEPAPATGKGKAAAAPPPESEVKDGKGFARPSLKTVPKKK